MLLQKPRFGKSLQFVIGPILMTIFFSLIVIRNNMVSKSQQTPYLAYTLSQSDNNLTNKTINTDVISGRVYVSIFDQEIFFRADVKLINNSSTVIATTLTDENGFYQFDSVPFDVYTVIACANIGKVPFAGSRTGVVSPNTMTNIYMVRGNCP